MAESGASSEPRSSVGPEPEELQRESRLALKEERLLNLEQRLEALERSQIKEAENVNTIAFSIEDDPRYQEQVQSKWTIATTLRESEELVAELLLHHHETLVQSKERFLCKVCWVREINMAFMPCGHLAYCFECAANLDSCAICRAAPREKCRLILSE